MSNRTYVCFPCRTTERVPVTRVSRRCRKCHAPAEHVYYKLRIPRRDDDEGWTALQRSVREINGTIKANALRTLQAHADRHSRTLAQQPPHRAKKAAARLREVREKIRKLEEWP